MCYFYTARAPTESSTLSLHDALPIYKRGLAYRAMGAQWWCEECRTILANEQVVNGSFARIVRHSSHHQDRKSTRLNSSHSSISYAVFCLTKKKSKYQRLCDPRDMRSA